MLESNPCVDSAFEMFHPLMKRFDNLVLVPPLVIYTSNGIVRDIRFGSTLDRSGSDMDLKLLKLLEYECHLSSRSLASGGGEEKSVDCFLGPDWDLSS